MDIDGDIPDGGGIITGGITTEARTFTGEARL
jgi:hypothetical protein